MTHIWQVEEHRSDNERHGKVTEQLGKGKTWVRFEPPPSSLETQLDLLHIAERVGRLGSSTKGECKEDCAEVHASESTHVPFAC